MAAAAASGEILRYGFREKLGRYLLLILAGISLLIFLAAFLAAGKGEGKSEVAVRPSFREKLCGTLVFAGALLLTVPLLRFGKLIASKCGYSASLPYGVADGSGIGNLLLYFVLPWAVLTAVLLCLAFPLLRRVVPGDFIGSLLIGMVLAFLYAEPLYAPVFFLLGAVLAWLSVKVGKVFALLLGVLSSLLFGMFAGIPLESSALSGTRTLGMLLLFGGVTLLLWVYGGGYLCQREKKKGIAAAMPWIVSGILCIAGCAFAASVR